MTAVANPPNFPAISRPSWGSIDGGAPMNPDDVRGMFVPQRKPLSRTNSSSSIQSSASSNSSTSTALTSNSQLNGGAAPLPSPNSELNWAANGTAAARNKRPQPKPQQQWPPQAGRGEAFNRVADGRPNGIGAHGPIPSAGPNQLQQMNTQGMMSRPMAAEQLPPGQPVLYLLSLNGTFERKTIAVPFAPDSLRIGRQTNQKTIPTASNGFFDSKVLSRQHAEVYSERNGKIYIRDVKSSNGTFVNGTRLSQENRESEPHELQTGDHLELGIDIVSEDQKTVVHHKVAAKVEHAGFMSASSNVMDMNFGDLDPANSSMMMPNGPLQMRGRTGSNASLASNGRMMPNAAMMNVQANNIPQQRPFFLSPIATDQILKRLANEMRSARLQAQDLGRTNQFVNTLLSKNDVKDLDKADMPEPASKAQHMVNGNGLPFRHDNKARFSEPPAPPPQQPLPEKPDSPALKRFPNDRPKSVPSNTSPVRQENLSQIIQLTEALNNAKRDIDTQTARMRELETMLQQEREARELAEDLAKRLEESASNQPNGVAVPPAADAAAELILDDAVDDDISEDGATIVELEEPAETEPAKETAIALQFRIDTMEDQMVSLREQMEMWKARCEEAESARDADRKTLAEMVVQLRAEEARRASRERRSRSRRRATEGKGETSESDSLASSTATDTPVPQTDGSGSSNETMDQPTLSRSNTITPYSMDQGSRPRQHLEASLPYASALGVVLIGMGLMAYLNGWQGPPSRVER